jgi:hypothetical protein
VLLLLAGCDFVFGVNGQPEACELADFDSATGTPLVDADEFSVDWDQTFAVISQNGASFQVTLPSGTPEPIDLGLYINLDFALAPEGDALFYTAAIEPEELRGALRGGNTWRLDAAVPRGTFAGTPSADVFGPRRVLVRVRANDETIQEFENDDGTWVPIGEPLAVSCLAVPNLTPNGLTMVYASPGPDGNPAGVFAQSRDTVDAAFGPPVALRAGGLRVPQLCGQCQQLYAIDSAGEHTMLVRFDR